MSVPLDTGTVARILANAVNPVLLLLIPAAPLLDRRWVHPSGARTPVVRWLATSAVSIAVTVVLAESGKHFQVWPGHPEFPSGHESFAAAAATCLVARDRRWSAVAVPLAVAIGLSLVRAGYHRPIEVVGGVVLGTVVSGTIASLAKPRVSASADGREASQATGR